MAGVAAEYMRTASMTHRTHIKNAVERTKYKGQAIFFGQESVV